MRITLILFTLLLLSVIYANCEYSKRHKSEGKTGKCSGEDRAKDGRKRVNKYKGSDEDSGERATGEKEFRWNKNFKNHKQNGNEQYDRKKSPRVYKSKDKVKEVKLEPEKVKKPKEKSPKSATETEEAVNDVPKLSKTELQCDSGEAMCSASV